MVNQRGHAIEHIKIRWLIEHHNRLGHVQRPAAHKHAQQREERLHRRIKQLVAPLHGVSDGLLMQRAILHAAGQYGQAALEPRQQRRRWNSLIRAAASSSASGRPSSRTQISAMIGAVSSVTMKSGLTMQARSTNRAAAAELASIAMRSPLCAQHERVGQHQRADHKFLFAADTQGMRLVTRMTSRGHAASSSLTAGAAPRICSKLSRYSSRCSPA